MNFTGQRVPLDLDSDVIEKTESQSHSGPPAPALIPTAFIGDILERTPTSATPPVAPSFKSNVNGFPAHKKRQPRVSTFKQQRVAKEQQGAGAAPTNVTPTQQAAGGANDERRGIDEENRQRLAAMSEAEIEQERNELLESLSPSLIQKLLGRANLDEGSNERNLFEDPPAAPAQPTDDIQTETKPLSTKKVSFAAPTAEQSALQDESTETATTQVPTSAEAELAAKAFPDEAAGTIHFPKTPQPPDLDPDDPNFLKNLHEKYFPNLAYDPSSLSWMAPIDPADKSSPYHPSQTAFNASELRFDFKGNLLAPSVAREIPVTKGLHHHADAPEAAGYTIPELAVLARSAVAAQRCMAYQTLGRILYRLGQGEFGVEKARQETDGPVKIAKNPDKVDEEDDEDDVGDAMAAGLWNCVEEGRVIETLTEEAARERGHRTAKTFAEEALWNWRRGGGRKRHAV